MTRVPCILMTGLLIGLTGMAFADASPTQSAWRYDMSIASFHLPEADLDSGGRTELTTYHFEAGVRRRITSGFSTGLTFNYGYYDRGFSGDRGFGALRPWDDSERLGLNASFLIHPDENWSYGIRPFVASFSEGGDISDESLSYGVALAAVSHRSSDRHLGLGVRITNRIDNSVKIIPLVVVNWRFNDHWQLSNPSEPDLIGAGGLELEFKPNDRWKFALLGAYHSPDFRLDGDGPAPGGIGEHEGTTILARVNRRWASGFVFKGYLGAVVDGALEIRDAEGRTIARSRYDTSPLAGLAVEKSF